MFCDVPPPERNARNTPESLELCYINESLCPEGHVAYEKFGQCKSEGNFDNTSCPSDIVLDDNYFANVDQSVEMANLDISVAPKTACKFSIQNSSGITTGFNFENNQGYDIFVSTEEWGSEGLSLEQM